MPIHDQSYRRYGGTREPVRGAWTVIAAAGIASLLRKRIFLGLLVFAWMPFLVEAGKIYFSANFPQLALLAPTADTFRQFFDNQNIFVFFMTIYVGAGLIANDRRANALQIYLSKPLSRAEYIGGKMAILVVFLLLVTFVPGILLLLTQVAFAGSFEFVRKNLFLFPAITLFSIVQVAVASFTMLALSSLSNSSRFVAVLYTGAVLFTDAMFGVLRGITGSTTVAWVSLPANLAQVGDLVFRVKLRYDTPVMVSAIVVLALIVVSISVLERRVRGVEVVT